MIFDWEQRELGEVVEIIMGQSPKGDSYTNNSSDYILVQGNADLKNGWVYPRVWTTQKTKTADKGDLILSVRAPVGEVAQTKFDVVLGRGVAGIKGNKFIFYLLYKLNTDKYWVRYSTGSTFDSINSKDLRNAKIYITDQEEQEVVSEFFKKIDTFITLHQRKFRALEQLKEGYLQKMFPQKGEVVPKVRFANFSEKWEERKIGEIFRVTRGNILATTKTEREKRPSAPYPVYSSQTANQGLMGYYNDYLYSDAITWTTDGANAGTVNYRKGKFYCTNVCGVLISEEGYANKMISEALNQVAWKYVSRVGNPKLMNNVMSEIVISIPKNIKEQNTISNFLERFDFLIILQQQKLNRVLGIKKAYLQKMFI